MVARLLVVLCLSSASFALGAPFSSSLDFSAPTPGTVLDASGFGTGFPTRLPTSGGAIPTNDPRLDIVSEPGVLRMTSSHADLNYQGVNLPDAEAPAVFVPNVGSDNLRVSATLRGVTLPSGQDQLFLFAGNSAGETLRGGPHDGNLFFLIQNHAGSGGLDDPLFVGSLNAFNAGDDLKVELRRTGGLWSLAWENLTSPGMDGVSGSYAVPWLDTSDDLYFGVHAANAGSQTSFVARIDDFCVKVVPEASSLVLGAFGVAGLGVSLWRRHRSGIAR